MESVVNMGKAGLISGVQKKGTKVGKGKGKVIEAAVTHCQRRALHGDSAQDRIRVRFHP